MSSQIFISRPAAKSAPAFPIISADFIVLRNALRLRLRLVESDTSALSQDSKQPLWNSPVPDLLSISLGNGKAVLLPPEEVLLASIYSAASHFENGVGIVAGFDSKLVLYSVPPDVFELSHTVQQKEYVLQPLTDEEIAVLKCLRRWYRNDDSLGWQGMKVTRGGSKSMWPLFLKATVFGGLDNVVDIAVNDVTGLSIRTFTTEGRAITWRIENGCHHIVELIARGSRVPSHYELDMNNDVVMTDAEDWDDRFVLRA
jgi:hypothetical protein